MRRPLHGVIFVNEGKQYYGSDCPRCGNNLRWTASSNCVACLREQNVANSKRWREKKKHHSTNI